MSPGLDLPTGESRGQGADEEHVGAVNEATKHLTSSFSHEVEEQQVCAWINLVTSRACGPPMRMSWALSSVIVILAVYMNSRSAARVSGSKSCSGG